MQYLRARLNNQPLPQVPLSAPPPSPAPDAAHAGNEQAQPDPAQAAALLDAALAGVTAGQKPGKPAAPQPLWLVDCGNFSATDVAFPGLRARTHLEALQLMGAVAAVPGSAELQLKAVQAQEFISASQVPVVSCNLQAKLEGAAVQPYVKLAPGWYLTGVTSWTPAPGLPPEDRWWELAGAVDSVRSVQKQLPPGARLIVVATYQPDVVIRELSNIAAVVVAPEPAAAPAGAPVLPPPTTKAEYLTLATLVAAGPKVSLAPWQLMLSDVWPDDPQVVALFKEEYQRIRERILGVRAGSGGKNGWKKMDWKQADKFLPPKGGAAGADGSPGAGTTAPGSAPASSGPHYAGAASCKPCHEKQYAVWENTAHFAAFASLPTAEDQGNLDCLKCHSTGLLQPGGYDPFGATAAMGAVGCEMCHGPGSQHNTLMNEKGKQAGGDLAIRKGQLTNCASCHDKYNSPKFEQQAYWAKVKH